MMIDIPSFRRTAPPSSTAFRSSRGFDLPTVMGFRDFITCLKTGYSTRLCLTTKVVSLIGAMMTGRTKVSSVLM